MLKTVFSKLVTAKAEEKIKSLSNNRNNVKNILIYTDSRKALVLFNLLSHFM